MIMPAGGPFQFQPRNRLHNKVPGLFGQRSAQKAPEGCCADPPTLQLLATLREFWRPQAGKGHPASRQRNSKKHCSHAGESIEIRERRRSQFQSKGARAHGRRRGALQKWCSASSRKPFFRIQAPTGEAKNENLHIPTRKLRTQRRGGR